MLRSFYALTDRTATRALLSTRRRAADGRLDFIATMSETEKAAKKPETVKLQGSCYCGKCKILIDGPVLFSSVCHCTICQRISGGRSVHYLGFPNEGLKVEAPDGQLNGFKTSDAMTRYTCATCHGPVYNQSHIEGYPFRDVPSGVLERDADGKLLHLENAATKVKVHIFYPTRTEDAHDDLPKFDSYPM